MEGQRHEQRYAHGPAAGFVVETERGSNEEQSHRHYEGWLRNGRWTERAALFQPFGGYGANEERQPPGDKIGDLGPEGPQHVADEEGGSAARQRKRVKRAGCWRKIATVEALGNETVYPHLPDHRSLLLVGPFEDAGVFGIELVEQRPRIVVVDDPEALAARQVLEGREDQGVTKPRGDRARVDDRFGGLAVIAHQMWVLVLVRPRSS